MTETTTTRPRPLHGTELRLFVRAADVVFAAFAVQVSPAQLAEGLGWAERGRLLELTKLLAEPEDIAVPLAVGPDERHRAFAFAAALERTPVDSKPLERELELLAEYTRRIRRLPTAAERAIFRGVAEGATLETLAHDLDAAAVDAPRTPGVNWGKLTEDEQGELEVLVERVVGLGFFSKRRGEQAARLSLDELVLWAERPTPRRLLAPPGAAVLPVGVLDDLAAGRLLGSDVAVLAVVALCFAGRRLHPAVKRDVALVDGDRTLVVRRGLHRLVPTWGPEVAPGMGTDAVTIDRDNITKRLVATRWLTIEPGDRETLRVRLGPRFLVKGNA